MTKLTLTKFRFRHSPENNWRSRIASRCHAFVPPQLLAKTNWRDVLPDMGHRMGIYSGGFRPDSLFDAGVSGSIVRETNIFPERPILAKADWRKIENYYLENAPDTILPPLRKKPVRIGLTHFNYREPFFSNRPSLTTMVKILPITGGSSLAMENPGVIS